MPRYNKSPNPSAANNLTGIRASSPTRITGLSGPPRTTGASVSMSTSAFANYAGGAVASCSSGQTWTGVGWVRSSVNRTIRIDLVRWQSGTFVAATDFTDVALSAGVWTKVRITATLPSGTFNEINWHADVPTSGTAGTLSISSWRIEQVDDSTLEYADGDDVIDGWSWDGTAGNSASIQSDTPPSPPSEPELEEEPGVGSAGPPDAFTPEYELVAVARIQELSGPPSLIPIDPISWTEMSWTEELSRPPSLNATCPIATLPDSIVNRLRRLREFPTELWLYRNGQLVFSGPWLTWQIRGEDLVLNALGALAYLRYMFITETLTFTAEDQLTIAKELVDHWQDLELGNFGIDTSGIGTSGVTRDITYERDELHNVATRLEELGERVSGFDIEVDPAGRHLRLWHPQQGVNRSIGADAVVFDTRNVTSPNVSCSVAPADIASEAFGVATPEGTQDKLWSHWEATQVRATFGRVGVAESFDHTNDQGTLNAQTEALLDARAEALLIPGPDAQSTADSDLSSYRVGDTVLYELHERLGITGAFRIRRRDVRISQTGAEAVSLEFQ